MRAAQVRSEPTEGATPAGVREPGRRRTLTRVPVGVIAVLVVLTVVFAVLFTVPLVSTTRTSVEWFGWTGYTPTMAVIGLGSGPAGSTCVPSNAVGPLTISFTWKASTNITTARAWWSTGEFEPIHIVYQVNNSSDGGYSLPPALLSFLCSTENYLAVQWMSGNAVILVTMSGVREYNCTTSVPIW
jgi:hypothetical protein